MSLTKSHPIWTTTNSNPYEVSKAIQQARFLSGRYRSEALCRHWSTNKNGWCLSPSCHETEEGVQHILLDCLAYSDVRKHHMAIWLSISDPILHQLLHESLSSSQKYQLQFMLDCSVLPSVIAAVQLHGPRILTSLFKLTRTLCHSIHRERMKLLGRWNFL